MKKRTYSALWLATGIAACGSDSGQKSTEGRRQETFHVVSYRTPCMGVAQRLCLMLEETATGSRSFFYDNIQGFEFIWGHTYELVVNVSPVENPLADGSSSRYELVNITSDIEDSMESTYSFERVDMLEATITKQADRYYFLGQAFTCAREVNCDDLVLLSTTGGMVDLVFSYTGNGQIQLDQWQ